MFVWDPPVALGAVDDGGAVRQLQAELQVRRLQVPLERVDAADVEPNVALQVTCDSWSIMWRSGYKNVERLLMIGV